MPAADIGHVTASLQLLDGAIERWEPFGHQMRVVARAEEALAAVVDVVHMLVPTDSVAAASRFGDSGGVEHRAQGDLKEPRQVGGTLGIGERDRLLGRQGVAAAVGVIGDKPARGLSI